MPSATAAVGRFQAHGYFPEADWLWRRIPTSPTLDVNSATWAGYFGVSDGAAGHKHICDIVQFGVALRGPGGSSGSGVISTTPRYDVVFRQANGGGGDEWGPDPFSATMPWTADILVPGITTPGITPTNAPPYDGHVGVADPTTGQVFSVWRAYDNGATKSGWWGRQVALYGDGREGGAAQQGSSTGARLSRYGAVIRASEMTAAAAAGYRSLDHALFFSTNIASSVVRYPASVGDGANGSGVATPIPEGARVQLDPSINVDGISGITTWERIIAKTLQTYGAYVGDNGAERMAFVFEYLGEGTTPNQPYIDVYGSIFDFYDMTHIPWSSLRVLKNWDGSSDDPIGGAMLIDSGRIDSSTIG